jgi:hypothetical protein
MKVKTPLETRELLWCSLRGNEGGMMQKHHAVGVFIVRFKNAHTMYSFVSVSKCSCG